MKYIYYIMVVRVLPSMIKKNVWWLLIDAVYIIQNLNFLKL